MKMYCIFLLLFDQTRFCKNLNDSLRKRAHGYLAKINSITMRTRKIISIKFSNNNIFGSIN